MILVYMVYAYLLVIVLLSTLTEVYFPRPSHRKDLLAMSFIGICTVL
jgi:hypothetical protein